MQAALLVVFILAIFLLAQFKLVWLAFIVFLLLLFDLFGGAFSRFVGFLGAVAEGIGQTASEEAVEVEAAKVKTPSGKKFIDEGLSKIGKEVGKSEKEKLGHKRTKSRLTVGNLVAAVDNFMTGAAKLFKR